MEVKTLNAHLTTLIPKELINKYYAIDRMSYSDVYYVKPLGENIRDLAGKFIPSERTWDEGKCIFLNEKNQCNIYTVRPTSAKISECWNNNSKKDMSKIIISKWEGDVLFKKFKINKKNNIRRKMKEGINWKMQNRSWGHDVAVNQLCFCATIKAIPSQDFHSLSSRSFGDYNNQIMFNKFTRQDI
jgi:Fe-S-cluster containining protein